MARGARARIVPALGLAGVMGCTIALGGNKGGHEVDGGGGAVASSGVRMTVNGTTGPSSSSASGNWPNGTPCTEYTECQSLHCYKGKVCCDSDCSQCSSCLAADTGLSDGTCVPVKGGTDPILDCHGLGTCNGMGACQCETPGCGLGCGTLCAPGQTCNLNVDCTSGHCQEGVCCDASCDTTQCVSCNVGPLWVGTCTPVFAGTSCGPGKACSNTGVPSMCVPGRANGNPCTNNADCVSGACTGGVCVIPHQPAGFPCVGSPQCGTANGCAADHFCQ